MLPIIFGCEMEGSWDPSLWDEAPNPLVNTLKSDSSLTCPNAGELTTKPLKTIEAFKQVVNELKPYYLGYNSSCGFHLHVSIGTIEIFKLTDYELAKSNRIIPSRYDFDDDSLIDHYNTELLRQAFNYRAVYSSFIKDVVARFPEVSSRLYNRYCSLLKGYRDRYTRYQPINYFNSKETVEFRIFPANELDRYVEYVEFTINWIEKNFSYMEKLFSIVY